MSENTRSQDFRIVFSNTFSIVFGPTEIQLTCGIQKNPGTNDTTMEEQVGLVITHPSAKLLTKMLSLLIADFEEHSGKEIPLDPGKIKKIEDTIAANKAARKQDGGKPKPT